MFHSAAHMDDYLIDIGKWRKARDEDFALTGDTKPNSVSEGHYPCKSTFRCPLCKTKRTVEAWITTQYCYRLDDGELGIADASFADEPEDLAFAELAVLDNTFVRLSAPTVEYDETKTPGKLYFK
jgi:hypothetical protein